MIKIFLTVWMIGNPIPLSYIELVDYNIDECRQEALLVQATIDTQNENPDTEFRVTCEEMK